MSRSALPIVIPAVLALLGSVSGMPTVYDEGDVPQGAAYPYVVLSSPTENRFDRMGRAGKSITLQAHVYASTDDVAGSGQAAAIADKIATALEYPTLSLGPSWTSNGVRVEEIFDGGDFQEGGPLVRHLIVMIRIEVLPT